MNINFNVTVNPPFPRDQLPASGGWQILDRRSLADKGDRPQWRKAGGGNRPPQRTLLELVARRSLVTGPLRFCAGKVDADMDTELRLR